MPNLQEERSAETRRRLMEATVACLHERGYSGTTTVEIAARAGVSRGGQLHHFPTKDELVVKALEYVFDLRVQEMRTLVAALPPGTVEDRLCKLIDLMWPVFKGPIFFAWLELLVASRTDPTLREPVALAGVQLGEPVRHGFMTVLEWPEDRPEELEALIDLIFGQLEAMALEWELCDDRTEDPPQLVRSLAWLKKLACSILAEVHPAPAPN
ncbi:MAG TPA: TetR/AcrR family transcriptional regulator [Candidatus Binataceae bacterium]|nr:TetR/AcrR family transcriptional regulator [Candidatus Binataceae bacterium]